MSATTLTLEPLQFPLHGRRLIEASAGTGKTWTLAALYLRLVLGHGGEQAFARPLLPPEILVVTFTNAATRELRDRIRSRLAEAARVFRGQQHSDEPFLNDLLNAPEYRDPAAQRQAAQRLDQAAQWMDEAAIYTIHGWSQRMLSQHAFASGSLFNQTLDNDERDLRAEIVRDYWRTYCLDLPRSAVQLLGALAADPETLAQRVAPLLAHPEVELRFSGETLDAPLSPPLFAERLQGWHRERSALEVEARGLWAADVDAIEQLLQAAVTEGRLSKTSFKPEALPEYLAELRQWSAGEPVEAKALARFTQSKLIKSTNKRFQPDGVPRHPAFEQLERLLDCEERQPELYPLLRHAAAWIETRLQQARLKAARIGFDDLLQRLGQALAGEGGALLAEQIRQQYPVALIDEFQDTDPVQYQSFRHIYSDADSRDTALLMIGDPKQAIYAFRGADIHTYLQARHDCGGRLYTLGTNYRSSTALVEAVNALFASAEAARPQGAFGFASADDNPLPFHSVKAKGTKRTLEIDGQVPDALQCWWLDPESAPEPGGNSKAMSKGLFRRETAERCASEICRLLTLAERGRAGFRDEADVLQPLRPGAIAILVRTGSEARWVRQALAQRRIRSVYLSDRESVFTTLEAQDLWRWLRACAEPEQSMLVHAALATATLDLTLDQLDRLNRDEQAWEAELERFRALRDCWRRQGVLAMIRRLLDQFDLPARLLQRSDGERALTNLLHLAELLQVAAQQLDGELALIRHFADLLQQGSGDAEELVMRLESDADRVQVITIHKSKGLEYPLVFLPFISDCRAVDGNSDSFLYHSADGVAQLELNRRDETAKQLADRERLQEDLRLLYVALTRPVHACWLTLAPIRELARSAVGTLLAGNGAAPEAVQAALQALMKTLGEPGRMALQAAPEADAVPWQTLAAAPALEEARSCALPVSRESWWIASYSALRQREGGAATTVALETAAASVPDSAEEETALESRHEPVGADMGSCDSVHGFRKGASAGTFLHSLLEWAAGEGFTRVASDAELRRGFLERQCQGGPWQGWQALLDGWLVQLLTAELPLGPQDSLRLVELAKPRAELEFWFPVRRVAVERLDGLVREHLLSGYDRPALEPMQLNGMLKGFIDLIFEYRGRYWVADYKSNWLGPDDAAYSTAAMRDAILHKRYDMQYALYTLALHRLLKARLPGYADDPRAGYEQHVGGALYLFLRGIGEPQQRGAFVERPPVALILALDCLFDGQPIGPQAEAAEVSHG